MPRGRPPANLPSPAELEVLSALWTKPKATVAQIQRELDEVHEYESAYTTILSMLQRLIRKGHVVMRRIRGVGHFEARYERADARRDQIMRMQLHLFDGSRERMIVYLFSEEWVREPMLKRLRAMIDQRIATISGERAGGAGSLRSARADLDRTSAHSR
jgi:predicted transcriptional regulator